MQTHEYSVIGHSRSHVGRYIGASAALLASITALLVMLGMDVAKHFGLSPGAATVIIFPLNATTFYFLGHWAFDTWMWRSTIFQKMMGVPDLNGDWICKGETKDDKGNVTYTWSATVTISQTWEKIRIYLTTGQSSSRSKSASLLKEPGIGYVLMYSYQNEPRIGEPELRAHGGYCELKLNEQLTVAEGDYFNNKGRVTFGRMKLERVVKANG